MPYIGWTGEEIEDLEADNMRRDEREAHANPHCLDCGGQTFNIALTDCFDMATGTVGEADDASPSVNCAECGREMEEASVVIIAAYWSAKAAR